MPFDKSIKLGKIKLINVMVINLVLIMKNKFLINNIRI